MIPHKCYGLDLLLVIRHAEAEGEKKGKKKSDHRPPQYSNLEEIKVIKSTIDNHNSEEQRRRDPRWEPKSIKTAHQEPSYSPEMVGDVYEFIPWLAAQIEEADDTSSSLCRQNFWARLNHFSWLRSQIKYITRLTQLVHLLHKTLINKIYHTSSIKYDILIFPDK